MILFICQFCDRSTTNAGANKAHENRCKLNPNPKIYKKPVNSGVKKGNIPWNKGLNKANTPALAHSVETKNKLSAISSTHTHTAETKNKISNARIAYLAANPDKVPYKLNHYSKGRSYPERYWKRIFDNAGLQYTEQYQIHTYQLDFALVDEKIDIEVDGDQHYLDSRIIESDKRRNEYLELLGWTIIRIKWSDYKKIVDINQRKCYVDSILTRILSR